MCLTPEIRATEFSILRTTSVSSCEGEAPGSVAVTVTTGSSRSGNICTFMARKPISPATVSKTNSITAGIGFLIDQVEKFMVGASSERSAR